SATRPTSSSNRSAFRVAREVPAVSPERDARLSEVRDGPVEHPHRQEYQNDGRGDGEQNAYGAKTSPPRDDPEQQPHGARDRHMHADHPEAGLLAHVVSDGLLAQRRWAVVVPEVSH